MAAPASVHDVDLSPLLTREFHPSLAAWEDQVLYFLLPDRFSNNNENDYLDLDRNTVDNGSTGTPKFNPSSNDGGNAIASDSDAQQWRSAGTVFVGGKLNRITSKLGYLHRLGITAIWVGPIFKQLPSSQTYHRYAIQDWLEIKPRFGTREDLRMLVNTAHSKFEIHVILDIILNYSGDVFAYTVGGQPWTGQVYDVKGFRDAAGQPNFPLPP